MSLVAGLLSVASAGPAQAAEVTDGLALWYKLDAQSGAVAADSSGNGRDGTVIGTAGWSGGQGLAFNGSDTYVKMPNNLITGMTAVTVSADVYIDPTLSGNYFFYNFGNVAVGSPASGTGYLFSTGNATYRGTISTQWWNNEQNAVRSPAAALSRGVWKHITYTLGGGTARIYEDGVQVGVNTAVTNSPASIGGGVTTANFVGKSAYAADKLFKGKIKDFRLYDRALTAAEVSQLSAQDAAVNIAADKAALTLGDTTAVTGNLTLPAVAPGGSVVTWTSSDSTVVSNTGVVTRPASGQPSATATLTATLTHRGLTESKTFDITVLPQFGDPEIAAAAAAALSVRNIGDVRGNLTLPATGENGTVVTWSSDNPSVIDATGAVHRPAHGSGGVTVTLTASVAKNQATATRAFTATVPELPAALDLKGYMFSYFTGEGTANGEQVYFGLSKGNNALQWRELNNGNPVLTSTLGEKGLRDPFIIRSPEGDKFYQIATDLRIYGGNGWDASQRTGSKSIMVWESTDLVNWTNQRLVKVSPDTAGNTWAPEAYYDEGLGAYVVFWASKIYAADDPNHTGSTYNKMLYATTRDFYTFSEPQVWVDPGYSVIDSTIIKDGGTYYRFTKDERNNTSSTPCSKFIIEQKSSSILNLNYDFVADCIGKGSISQGEGPLVFKSNTEQKWYLFIDEFGGRGYIPFETTDLASGVWKMSSGYSLPSRPRHGTVLPVTAAEYDRLLRAYQPDQLAESADDVNTVTGVGDAPVLPGTVTAHYVGGAARAAAVTWDEVPASAYAAAGTFTVEGTLVDSATVRARANVTVSVEGVPVESLTVSPTSLRLGVGVSRKVNATVLPANATARRLTWTSSDSAIATVSSDGTVTTVGAGAATIMVSTADNSQFVAIPVEVRTDIPADLVLRYTFDETGGTVAQDVTGRGNDGTYVRTPAWGTGVDGGSFKMSGGSSTSTTAPYVQIPNGVLNGADSVTVSTWVKWNSSTTANQWIYGLGQDRNKYLFTGPYNGSGRLFSAITTGSWQAESQMVASSSLAGNTWKHVTVVVDSSAKTAVMYLDGVEIARATNVAVKPSDLYDAARSYSGYIGRSLYAEDPYFAGEVDDFRVYNRVLSAEEVLEVAGKTTTISGASLPELKIAAILDDANSRIKLPVREGSDLANLAPQFTTAHGSTVSPASGTVRDLTSPVTYTVTGSDGASRTWTVEALVMRSPVIPGLYADPNITVFGDTFYIYPTTDGFSGWTGTQFHAFSSKDLVHWTDHGVILDLGPDVSWADNSAWAPSIVEKNGKYHFYFSGGLASGNTSKHLGVAVADSPTGPFHDALGAPLVAAGTYSGQMIDTAVFTDDDGRSYLYWGNGNSYQVPLNDDMVSFDAAAVKTYKPTGYNEGTFVFKRGGVYYFTWSENDTRSEDYQVAYATGTSPTGPWSARQGVILSKDLALGIKGTGHHSVVQVPGTDDWYIAYHRFAMPGGNGFNRETTIDRLEFAGDGAIRKVVPTLESVDPITIVHAGTDVSGNEGSAISLAGTSSAESVATTWTYRPVAGVDAGATCAFADAGAPATTITCTDDGTYEVTISGGRSSDTATVTVHNAAPVITGAVTGPADPAPINTPVSVAAPIYDAGGNDTLACSVDWADGTTSAGVLAAGACSAGHAYPAAGIYRPTITVTDDDGGSTTETFEFAVVYDPSAGFVTGSGWIDSPAGTYPTNPAVAGKVNFGFVSQYKKGATAPDGDTEFYFQAANLSFQSTRYEWLVVSGPQARYQGSGTLNGAGDYGFEVTTIDGGLGGDGVDRFQIKIWDRTTGNVVYDTGTAGNAIGGGSIVIHVKK